MMKKLFAVTAVSMALILGITGCSGVADLFKGDKKKDSSSDEDAMESLVPIDECNEQLLADIEDLVVLGQYKDVEVAIDATEVSDEQVQVAINVNLQNAGTVQQIKEGTVAENDTVNIDYEGKVDGVAFDGGTAQGYDLTIGSGSFIEGFEDSLIGMAVGSTNDIKVTFPDPYKNNPDLAGKEAVFTVTINYKHGDTIPAELTDEWVASLGLTDVSTVDQYRDYIRAGLEDEAESQDQQAVYEALMDKIVADSQIKGYEKDLDKETLIEGQMQAIQDTADSYDMEIEDLISQSFGTTLEEYKEGLANDVDKYADRVMIYRAVFQAEKMEVTQDEYEERVSMYSPQYEQYNEKSEADFIANNSLEIYSGLLNQKVENFLLENAKVTKN